MPIAPWLQGPNVLGALQAGSSVGLQIAAQREAAQRAADAYALQARQQAASEAQAAERLRLAHDELFQQARQQEIAQQFKADEFAQQRQRFDLAQQRQAMLDEANKQFGSTLGAGLQGESPDVLGAFSKAAIAAPLAEGAQKLDIDSIFNAQNRKQNNGYQQAALIRLEQQTGIPIPRLPDGTPEPNAYAKALQKSGAMAETKMLTSVQRRAKDYVESVKRMNPNISDSDLAEQEDMYVSSNGESAKVPPKELTVITAGDQLATGLDQALKSVAAFNAKFGKDAFDQFQGSFDNRLFNLRRKFGKKFTAEDEIEARKIFQSVDQVAQAYRLANFGSALSASEQKLFDKIIESPDSASFIPTLEGAVSTTKKIIGNKMEVYPYAQNIPLPIRARYTPSGESAPAAGGAPVRVSSKAQYDALPSGAVYIDDSGKPKRKK